MVVDDDACERKKKKKKASAAAAAAATLFFLFPSSSSSTSTSSDPFFLSPSTKKQQLPGDAKLSYFDAENTMQEISVDELTRGKRVGESFCLFVCFSSRFRSNNFLTKHSLSSFLLETRKTPSPVIFAVPGEFLLPEDNSFYAAREFRPSKRVPHKRKKKFHSLFFSHIKKKKLKKKNSFKAPSPRPAPSSTSPASSRSRTSSAPRASTPSPASPSTIPS